MLARTRELLAPLADGALVLVSSQLPVGSVARLESACAEDRGTRDLRFACLPENLRLGDALASFRAQDRVVAGVRSERDRLEVAELLEPFDVHVEWMKVESAEMTKHALNGFLATSVAFINEVSSVCEAVGADAAEVSRGLKSERRIGPRSYLAPGDAFAGGTLARDIGFLRDLAARHSLPDEVFAGVAHGNAAHRGWAQRKVSELLGGDSGSSLAGQTAPSGPRLQAGDGDPAARERSSSAAGWPARERACARTIRPSPSCPPTSPQTCISQETPLDAAQGASALVVCTAWPQYREVAPQPLHRAMESPLVIDAAGWLAASVGAEPGFRYVRVGEL